MQNLTELEFITSKNISAFEVPTCDPSLDKNGNFQFISGCRPSVGLSYNEILALARNNGLKLGTRNHWRLFLGTLIHRLIEAGWTEKDAFYAVCNDSGKLGNFSSADFELTGSKRVVGKCDLGNTIKILAGDDNSKRFPYWFAGGYYFSLRFEHPLASVSAGDECNLHFEHSVPFFIF